jgi:hypothetical protein
MLVKYILRLDDACPTMDRNKWQKIEEICDKYDIKPIVAVIPENKDKLLNINSYDNNFWDKVRNWQKKGWNIALHGYNHLYCTKESGFLPFNKRSEFAGLSYEEQVAKIKKAWDVFKKEKINSKIWIAPSHTFDKSTLEALKIFTDIEIISDGIGLFPYIKYNFKWIPQQFWKVRKMPIGVWTFCYHPNTMKQKDFLELENFIKRNKKNFIDLNHLKYKRICILNNIFKFIYNFLLIFKKRLEK